MPDGKMLPKAGVLAHYEAEVVVKHIVSELSGARSRASFNGKGFCWIELGDGKAGFASGAFYAEPSPKLRMYPSGRLGPWGKIAFEKWWLRHWFQARVWGKGTVPSRRPPGRV